MIALGLEATIGVIPPTIQILGALLIVGGGIILSIEEAEDDEDSEGGRQVNWLTVGLMMLSSFIVALIYVLFKEAANAETSSYVAVGFWSGLGMFLTASLIWLIWVPYRRDFNAFCKEVDRKSLSLQFLNELMDTSGAYLTHLANVLGPSVMLVTAFNAVQPVFVVIIGVIIGIFGIKSTSTDQTNWKTWLSIGVSVVLITVGTVFIALK